MKSSALLLPVFSLTLFTSALLLFWVEPMFGKMMLPLLGGAPSVWITAMLFYQLALLAGYAYAHATSRWMTTPAQMIVHFILMIGAFIALPIAIPAGWIPPGGGNPAPWLLGLLTVALGAPFVVLSATTPMVQRWFSGTRHPQAANPYFLYAVSNIGSFAGLFAYPLVIEPFLKLSDQSHIWGVGYALLLILAAVSAILAHQMRGPAAANTPVPGKGEAVSGALVLRWIILALVPSSLMLSVTTYITTDIAAIPLMWVVPLALYLLTFIIAFSNRPVISSRFALWVQPFLLAPLCIALIPVLGRTGVSPLVFLPVHLAVFFFSALICHFELVRLKPAASQLTKFFLMMSLGGALGGVFNVVVAPVVFNDVYEYPLGLMAACLLRPWPENSVWRWKAVIACAAGSLALIIACAIRGQPLESSPVSYILAYKLVIAVAAFLLFFTRRHPLWMGLCVGALLMATMAIPAWKEVVFAERNFFGVIRARDAANGGFRMLEHGTTIHGMQALDAAHRLEPLSYYSRYGGMGEALTELSRARPVAKIAVIGLGVGSLACYGAHRWRFTFYEIDPAMADVARNDKLFSFLSDCKRPYDIVLGDGRLMIGEAAPGTFDAIVLDAFSSDVIPLHLLTREAMQIYLDKLAPGGVIILHLSNRYLYLSPTVAAIALSFRLPGLERGAPGGTIPGTGLPYYGSIVVALGRKPADIEMLAKLPGWQPLKPIPGVAAWTDDYSNLLQPFILGVKGGLGQ